MNEFQDITKLETKKTNDTISDSALALEGGAFRGIYTAGVLDYFVEHGLNLNICYGVSAGALNGVNYLSGNFGRGALTILEHRKDKEYVGLKAYKESGSVIGFRFMFEEVEKEYPLNEDVLFSGEKTLHVCATNVYTGKPEYFTNHMGRQILFDALRASASLPIVSKMVRINGKLYLDGGCSSKLPIRQAIADGNKKIIFIGTRNASYRRKKNTKEIALVKKLYHRYPRFIDSFSKANQVYNEDCDMIDELVKEKRIYRLTPSKNIKVSRLEKSIKKLSDLYYLGYNDAKDNFEDILNYLNA